MAEYIERKEIIKAIAAEACHCLTLNRPAEACGYIGAKELIERRKAADVAEVRRGRLISTGYDELYCEFGNCTVCGADNPIYNKFCGQCGARMDKEDEQ